MMATLKTKNAFITGGAQGLGKSYMDALLAQGAKVVFGDINETVGSATEKEFRDKYGIERVKFIHFDATDGAKFEEAFKSAIDFMGYVDLMVNNAGFLMENVWEKMIALNYGAVVRGTLLASEHMRKDKGGKGGRIINCSSEFGLIDAFQTPIYCGTKHAVRSFTSCLAGAPDVKTRGVEYGILCPCPASTDLIHKLDKDRIRYMEMVKPEKMAEVLVPVERVQEAFRKLVLLESMNGAILYVNKDELNFYKMEKVNLGDTWPLATA